MSDLLESYDLSNRRDERRCVSAARNGDRKAFEILAARYLRNVYGLAVVLTGNTEEAFDVSQEALTKAFKKIRTYDFRAPFGSWLLSITRNTFRDRARKESRLKRKHEAAATHASITQENINPETMMTLKERALVVHEALTRIAEPFREAVHLYDIQGLSYNEISEVCDVAVGTVKSRLRRGRDALRRELIRLGLVGRSDGKGESLSRGDHE